jgi:hypothetical protein
VSSEIIDRLETLFLDQAAAAAEEGNLKKMSRQIGLHKDAQSRLAPVRTFWINETLAYIAEKFGEEEVLGLWKKWLSHGFEKFDALGAEGRLEWMVGAHNSLGSAIKSIVEKDDRYVLTLDPCGSGGIMRRKGMLGEGSGVTRVGHPWSWGKTGVPYYCAHCAIGGEIIPTEIKGKAWYVMDFPDDPRSPCVYNFLK